MTPIIIIALLLLAAGVLYQELRLRKVLRALNAVQGHNPVAGSGTTGDCQSIAKATEPAPPSDVAARARHLVELLFPVHSWHGISPGAKAPETVTSFIEIVPTDTVKYELDKASGHLCIDRPQHLSSLCPTLYGFIPRTYCAERVGQFCCDKTGRQGIIGDGDPLDICILTEKDIPHGNILTRAKPIGGLRMIDGNRADDKIIAVLESDLVYGKYNDVSELPQELVRRLRHYFLTYKQLPDETNRQVEITHVYGCEEAQQVIVASLADYRNHYGAPETRFEELRRLLLGDDDKACASK